MNYTFLELQGIFTLEQYPSFAAAGINPADKLDVIITKLINLTLIHQPITFTIGDGGMYTPALGATSYVNTTIAGLKYIVQRNGVGTLDGTKCIINLTGGFSLASGDNFKVGDSCTLIFFN